MTKFVIIAPTRSGSNMLVSALNKHSKITCRGESLKRYSKVVQDKNKLLCWFKKTLAGNNVVGFKLLYEHVNRIERRGLLISEIFRKLNIKVFHLRRKSFFQQYLSFIAAVKTNQWGGEEYRIFKTGKKLPIESFEGKIAQWTRCEREVETLLASIPHLDLWYEELVENWEKKRKEILEFLVLEDINIQPSTVKQFVGQYNEHFEELSTFLEWMRVNYPERI